MILELVARSLVRHRGRTLLAVVAVALSVMAVILVSALVDGLEGGFLEQLTGRSGHVRIQAGAEHELDAYSLEDVIPEYSALRDRVAELPRVRAAGALFQLEALLLVEEGRRNFPVVATGVELDPEGRPRDLLAEVRRSLTTEPGQEPGDGADFGEGPSQADAPEDLPPYGDLLEARSPREGSFRLRSLDGDSPYGEAPDRETPGVEVAGGQTAARSSAAPFPPDEGAIVISQRVADLLEVSADEPVVLLSEDVTGAPVYRSLRVAALFQTDDPDFDRTSVFLAHETAEEMAYQYGATRQIALFLDDRADALAVAERIREMLANTPGAGLGGPAVGIVSPERSGVEPASGEGRGADNSSESPGEPGGLRVRTWEQIHEGFLVTLELFDLVRVLIVALMVVVAGGTIANTILMSVFDRAQEFGTMRAIGLKRRAAFGLVVAEGAVVALAGVTLATILTVPVLLAVPEGGVYVGEVGVAFGVGERLRPVLTLSSWLTAAGAGLGVALVGAGYAGYLLWRSPITSLLREE